MKIAFVSVVQIEVWLRSPVTRHSNWEKGNQKDTRPVSGSVVPSWNIKCQLNKRAAIDFAPATLHHCIHHRRPSTAAATSPADAELALREEADGLRTLSHSISCLRVLNACSTMSETSTVLSPEAPPIDWKGRKCTFGSHPSSSNPCSHLRRVRR